MLKPFGLSVVASDATLARVTVVESPIPRNTGRANVSLFKLWGRPGLVGARGRLGQGRYFKYFQTNANQITVGDALRRRLPVHRDSTCSRLNAVYLST